MLVTPAFAQDAGAGFGGIEPLIPLILIFVVFYFLLIRPQQKKAKVHREMIAELRRGDRIVTSGGLIGQIHRVVGDSELMVEISDGVRVRIMRAMVAELLAKTDTRRARDEADEPDDEPEDEDEAEQAEDEDDDAPRQSRS